MSHQLSATHLVHRLTGSLSAPRTRKIGTLTATGLMPALLAACGSSSSTTPSVETGAPISSTAAYLIDGSGVLGLFGRQILAYDPDGDGTNEIIMDATISLYVSNFSPARTSRDNFHRVDQYESLYASGWTYSGVATLDENDNNIGFARFAAGDIDGDGFDDLIIGEAGVGTRFLEDFFYATDSDGNRIRVTGHDIQSTGLGRVALFYGEPNGVLGEGALTFDRNLASLPANGYEPFGEQERLLPGNVLLGGVLQGIGDDVAVGNVLGAPTGLPEILIVSSGRGEHARFDAQGNGARISVVQENAFGGVGYLSTAVVPGPTVGSAFDASTLANWTIFTGISLSHDGGADFAREAADSPLDVADINGDGITDILVGRYEERGGTGNLWTGVVNVVYGQTGTLTGTVLTATNIDLRLGTGNWEGTANALGFTVSGFPSGPNATDRDFAGASVTGVDINGDGIKDLIIGTPGNTQEFNSGQVYVIYGATSGLVNIDVSNADWHDNYRLGFEIKHNDPTGGDGPGALGAGNLGASVSSAGDFNHDGIEDLAIGAPTFSTSVDGIRAGAVYIVFGRDTNWSLNPATGDPTSDTLALQTDFSSNILVDQDAWTNGGQYGFRITGSDAWARLGIVEGLGDVNGDAIDDLGIGATYSGTSGSVFTIFGADQTAFSNMSIGESTFQRLRDGVAVDADGEPIETEEATPTPTAPVVVAAGPDAASAAPDAFFDVA